MVSKKSTHRYPTLKKVKKVKLKGNALDIFRRRYALKDKKGKPKETVRQAFRRVASHVAEAEETSELKKLYADYFFRLLADKRFVPNTPTWTGAKTKLGQLAACFVLPVEDEMGREKAGIFQTLKDAALIQQTGGGIGFSFSRLRPKGDLVGSSHGQASGPVSFMEVYDAAFGQIAQGGTRRGANMAVLRVDHPDIFEFIKCKAEEGRISNFNISVGVTDQFMEAVKKDKPFDLINPRNGKVWKTVQAREIFDQIVKYAYGNGEPGVLFLDTANRENPVPQQYTLEATNPCLTGEDRVFTNQGLLTIKELYEDDLNGLQVLVDKRLGRKKYYRPAKVVKTGIKQVYRLVTKEGYEIKLTKDHRLMTQRGWVRAGDLVLGDEIFLSSRKGGFGREGTAEEGKIIGWLVGDGTMKADAAVLSFFGQEKAELAGDFAYWVTHLLEDGRTLVRSYPVSAKEIKGRNEARVESVRLWRWMVEKGIKPGNKLKVPERVFRGSEAIQRGFLQALFTADGHVSGTVKKGVSVRLTSVSPRLLKNVQLLLLNFGIASKIYFQRRERQKRLLPDGKGDQKEYWCRAQHDLVISKDNLITFFKEIGFLCEAKNAKLASLLKSFKRGPYEENFTVRFKRLVKVGLEEVYDLTESVTASFVANGLVVHNCGEQWLGPYENCCLGHINLNQSVKDGKMDWEHLKESVVLGTRFLDDVISQNAYVDAVPQLEKAALKNRRIGLGFLGLADAMYQLEIRYGSQESLDFVSQVTEFIRYHSMLTSIDLAEEKGPFPGIQKSIYQPKNLKWRKPRAMVRHKKNWGRPSLDWAKLRRRLKKHGIRNATQMTVAPTGTTATVLEVEGYGCEPVFALAYSRQVFQSAGGEKDLKLEYVSPSFKKALDKTRLSSAKKKKIIQEALKKGSIQHLKEVPSKIKKTFVVSTDIQPKDHVRLQAAIQRFVDNSISKTCNFPAEATVEDVEKAYWLAWRLGCKGLTVYVTGSRQKIVLETKETAAKKKRLKVKPRPAVASGKTYRVETPVGTAFVTVNANGKGEPLEVFVNVGKAGSDIAADAEAIGRLISLNLRVGADFAPQEVLAQVVDQLAGIGGGESVGFGKNKIRSLADGIAKVLKEYVGGQPVAVGQVGEQVSLLVNRQHRDLCPDCGRASLIFEEGCARCLVCGYEKC